eukprot:scaffold118008_cov63-Phaeocystis_antarctica.AAC.1
MANRYTLHERIRAGPHKQTCTAATAARSHVPELWITCCRDWPRRAAQHGRGVAYRACAPHIAAAPSLPPTARTQNSGA